MFCPFQITIHHRKDSIASRKYSVMFYTRNISYSRTIFFTYFHHFIDVRRKQLIQSFLFLFCHRDYVCCICSELKATTSKRRNRHLVKLMTYGYLLRLVGVLVLQAFFYMELISCFFNSLVSKKLEYFSVNLAHVLFPWRSYLRSIEFLQTRPLTKL